MLLRGGSRGWAAPPYDPHVPRPTTGWSHTHNHWIADAGATLIAVGANFCLLAVINAFAAKFKWESKFTRKLLHIGLAMLGMSLWPLYSTHPTACLWAAGLMAGQTLVFLLVGIGKLKFDTAVRNVSRSGQPAELLKGPMAYTCVLTFAIAVFFREIPGILAVCVLAVGDGFADILGRKYGKTNPLPWSDHKSWAGSGAFFVTSFVAGMVYSSVFMGLEWASRVSWGLLTLRVLVASLLSALVESLPINEWDNPLVASTGVAADYMVLAIAGAVGASVDMSAGMSQGLVALIKLGPTAWR